MPQIKVVVLLVRQLRHGFTKKAKVSTNLTVAHMHTCMYTSSSSYSDFYMGSMYDDILCLHVARSYTSSAYSPFSLIASSLRYSSLPSTLYFHFHLLSSNVVFLSSHRMSIPLQPNFLDFLCDLDTSRVNLNTG